MLTGRKFAMLTRLFASDQIVCHSTILFATLQVAKAVDRMLQWGSGLVTQPMQVQGREKSLASPSHVALCIGHEPKTW